MSAFRHIPSKRTKTVAWITQMATEVPDLLREAKIFKGTIVPSNSIMKVKFKLRKSQLFNRHSSSQNTRIVGKSSKQLGNREPLMYSFTFKTHLI